LVLFFKKERLACCLNYLSRQEYKAADKTRAAWRGGVIWVNAVTA
jgi:hypothetical protein